MTDSAGLLGGSVLGLTTSQSAARDQHLTDSTDCRATGSFIPGTASAYRLTVATDSIDRRATGGFAIGSALTGNRATGSTTVADHLTGRRVAGIATVVDRLVTSAGLASLPAVSPAIGRISSSTRAAHVGCAATRTTGYFLANRLHTIQPATGDRLTRTVRHRLTLT
ncbi:hypothetical protein, partial [Amycolatopsis circi]|uniref:hypothetical protein n=1 Tax=Amycolatopsis circi TaxID=871959 RepID=UPI0013BE9FD1